MSNFGKLDSIDETESQDRVRHAVIMGFNDVEWKMLEVAFAHDCAEGALENMDMNPNIGMWPNKATFLHNAAMNFVMDMLEDMEALDERGSLKEEYDW